MNRKELKKYIAEVYNTEPEYLWIKHPNYELFRHSDNRKWFAVIMELSKAKLGLNEEGMIDNVNLKCDPILIGSLRLEPGFFPAYGMSKTNWITVALDESASSDKIKMLLDMSFQITSVKAKKDKSKSY